MQNIVLIMNLTDNYETQSGCKKDYKINQNN